MSKLQDPALKRGAVFCVFETVDCLLHRVGCPDRMVILHATPCDATFSSDLTPLRLHAPTLVLRLGWGAENELPGAPKATVAGLLARAEGAFFGWRNPPLMLCY